MRLLLVNGRPTCARPGCETRIGQVRHVDWSESDEGPRRAPQYVVPAPWRLEADGRWRKGRQRRARYSPETGPAPLLVVPVGAQMVCDRCGAHNTVGPDLIPASPLPFVVHIPADGVLVPRHRVSDVDEAPTPQ